MSIMTRLISRNQLEWDRIFFIKQISQLAFYLFYEKYAKWQNIAKMITFFSCE